MKHVQELVQKGKRESDLFTHAESLVSARIMDEVRRQIGVRYASDRTPRRVVVLAGAVVLGAWLLCRKRF